VSPIWYSLDVPLREIIENGNLVACFEKLCSHHAPDVPGSTCDEKFQFATSAPAAGWNE